VIKPPRAAIFFYDEATGEFKVCNVQRSKLQPFIDRAVVMTVPRDEHNAAITDEDARRLGGMLMLMQGHTNSELRHRFEITTEHPMNWDTMHRPDGPAYLK
jgi:hypothetical protein